MGHIEHISASPEAEEENPIEEALLESGLSHIEAPKPGTAVFRRLLEAAENYMREVRTSTQALPGTPAYIDAGLATRGDSENYFAPPRDVAAKISSSDAARRKYHDQLCVMLLGENRGTIDKRLADQVSNFAAYLTGDEDYLDTWG
jgi:hypothetical protein